MAWKNVHKWIVRQLDDENPKMEQFYRYVELESIMETTQLGNSVLHLAVLGKSSLIARYLIDNGPHSLVNQINNNHESPLHWACRAGNLRTISMLLQNGAAVNQRTYNGDTPLHFAIESGNLKAAKLLIRAGADINLKNFDSMSVLRTACLEREMKIIRYLVNKGVEYDDALEYHMKNSNTQIVKNIIKGVEPSRCVDKFNHNPIHIAVIHNKYKLAKILSEHYPDWIKAMNNAGKTPADLLGEKSDNRLRHLLTQE